MVPYARLDGRDDFPVAPGYVALHQTARVIVRRRSGPGGGSAGRGAGGAGPGGPPGLGGPPSGAAGLTQQRTDETDVQYVNVNKKEVDSAKFAETLLGPRDDCHHSQLRGDREPAR